jgi:hypothetical protein
LAPATEEEFQNEVVAPKEEKKREKEAVLNSPALEPVAEPVTAPVAEPVTAPVAEPVTAPVAEPVTAPVAEPVTPSVVEPVARPAPKPAKVIPQKLKAPVLPKNQNFEIKINQKKSLPVENTRMPAAEEEEYYVDLTWPEVPGAKYYDVEIYTDTNEAIIKERVDINEWRWNRPKLGTYFWKIAAVDSNNIIGDYSNLETINLNFDFKKYFVIKNFKSSISRLRLRVSEEPTVTWKWDSVPLATSYRLRLSYSANFKNVFFEKEINENTFTWDATAFAKKNPDRPVFMDLVAIYNNSIFSLVERDRFIAIVKGSYLIKKQIDSSYLVFNYAPSQSTYKISSATIQGKSEHIIPISFQINSGFQLSKKSFVFSALEYKASKFFSDSFDPGIDYQDIGVESQYGRSLYNWRQFGFALSLGLRFHRLTEITASSSASIGGAEENYISLMVNTFLDQILNDRWAHYAKFGVGVGGLSIINFEYNLKHTIRRSVFANVGAKYIYKTTTGTTDIAITDEQIFLGLGWELPF